MSAEKTGNPSDGFVASLTALAPVVAFSAAIPGQGGTNHRNEQWPEYWVAIWSHPDVEWWHAQNLLLFAEPREAAARPALAQTVTRTGFLSPVHHRSFHRYTGESGSGR